MNLELTAAQLRRVFDPASIGVETTASLDPREEIIGQSRASSALHFGLGMQEEGFNIYVAGPSGSGKMTAVRTFLEKVAEEKEQPSDWCYVHNFDDPYQPNALELPPGRGRELQQDMRELVALMSRDIPSAFESEDYEKKRAEIMKDVEQKRSDAMRRLREQVIEAGFALETTPHGIALRPLGPEGKPLSDADVSGLTGEKRQDLDKRRDYLQKELKTVLKNVREFAREIQQRGLQLDLEMALYVAGASIQHLIEKYSEMPKVVGFLEGVQKEVLEDIDAFKGRPSPAAGLPALPEGSKLALPEQPRLRKYQVNLLIDRSSEEGAPIVVELNASYHNLIGRIEKEAQLGALHTDFILIRPGSLHRANGGYLVVPADDVLQNPGTWDGLKRALRSREVQIEDLSERLGYAVTRTLRPQPIPLRVKIVLVGRPRLYYVLHAHDDEFSELFKVRADFDTSMDGSDENIKDFVTFLCTFCCKEQCRHLDDSAIAKVLEHAARLAGDQEKLSTRFGALADLVREADFWARKEAAGTVSAAHVQTAIEEKVYRSNLVKEKIQEMIVRGSLLIDTHGEAVGQVNGLAVLRMGDHSFGKPSRITASVGPGRKGILDIEREVELGGALHSKGVLILNGYLARRFAQDEPLSLSARLVFEQSYEGVDGDSASSTELYAVLSGLSGLSIRQGIAVTGSVNQAGEVQPIGGVNQKIEGFYDVCSAQGLTGEQGVLIPQSNVKNLMLREDVVEAVRYGQFHVWAVGTINQGIEILTGVPAGEHLDEGGFADGSVNDLVARRLKELRDSLKTTSRESE